MKNRESFEEDEEEENTRQSLNCFSGNIKTLEVSSLLEDHYNNITTPSNIARRRTTPLSQERNLSRYPPPPVSTSTGV